MDTLFALEALGYDNICWSLSETFISAFCKFYTLFLFLLKVWIGKIILWSCLLYVCSVCTFQLKNHCQVSPDIKNNDDMDIREYVKIKKIPEGSRSECRIVSGVVCTKNVVHKKMAPAITQPVVLMLACPVDYQVSISSAVACTHYVLL